MAHPPSRPPATAPALIVVSDPALASSLELMLEAYGVAPATHDLRLGLSTLPLRPEEHLVVDFKLLLPDPDRILYGLRSAGWRGAGLLMTERAFDRTGSLPESCWTIEKPFVAADLLSIFRQIHSKL